jgi:hypothetical protein
LNWFSKILVGLLITLICVTFIYFDIAIYLPLIAIPILLFKFILRSNKNWIQFFIFTIPLWSNLRAQGINPLDLILITIWIGGLAIWFINSLFIEKRKLIRNLADWFIIFFFIMYLGYMIMGIVTGTSQVTSSISEFLRASVILIYFPLREEVNTKEKLKIFFFNLIIALIISFVIWAFQNYFSISNAKNIYELTKFKRTNQEIFMGSVIFGAFFYLNKNTPFNKIIILGFIVLSGIGLIVTLSRVYWIATFFSFIIGFVYFDIKKKINIIQILILLVSIFLLTLFLIIPDFFSYLSEFFLKRLNSLSKFSQDNSFLARFDEIGKLWHQDKMYFFGGTGLSKNFTYYNSSFDLVTWDSDFVHNAYVHLSYKAGIPMAILYFSTIIYYCSKAFSSLNKLNLSTINSLYLASATTLFSFLIVSLVTSTFASRPGGVFLAIVIAMINIADNLKNDK